MINTILPLVEQAMMAGYGEEQILNFLSKTMPSFAKGIKAAKASGADASKILRFMSYATPNKNKANATQQQNANDKYLSGIGIKTKEEREAQRNKVLKGALGLGAGVLGATVLPKAAQTAVGALQGLLP